MRSAPDALAAPDVEDVGCALLVVAVGATRLDEAMALIEPLRSRVRRERPELEALRAFTLGHLDQ
jgi:cobalamin biosynthesis Co2+ chelatase CbiK